MHKNIHKIIWMGILLGVSTVLIAFETVKYSQKECSKIDISIANQVDNYFVEEDDILQMITLNGTAPLLGSVLDDVNLRKVEQRLKDNPFLGQAQVFVDHAGTLRVKVALRRPIARIVRYDGPDAYVGEQGYILPVSDKYTIRTLVITGTQTKKMSEQLNIAMGEYNPLFQLIKKIKEDKFWSAQIAQIKLLENGEVELFPQVTKQKIEFGKPKYIDTKFKKLKLFYEDILPRKGWNYYSRVSLKYKNQIICE